MIVGEEGIHIKPLYLIMMKNQLGNMHQCKTLIRHQHVLINGKIIDNPDYLVSENDSIWVNGKSINSQPFHYIMMNKPKGYICANRDAFHPCVIDLIEEKDCFCVGRLDKDTTGLLFITNDSHLSKKLLLPQYHIDKIYAVTTKYPLDHRLKFLFFKGIVIDSVYQCLPAQLEILDSYHCLVTIQEGKYHQIKKMFLSCQNEVVELKRITFASLSLDQELKEGEFRYLTKEERQCLYEYYLK